MSNKDKQLKTMIKSQVDPSKIISLKIGVYATHDDPETWVEFDPEDLLEMAMVKDNGYNYMFLTIQSGGNSLPIWRDYAEFFDAELGMCGSTDFLQGIQALKEVKEAKFTELAQASVSFGRKITLN